MKASRLFLFLSFSLLVFNSCGCGPTYPKGRVDKCVIDLCKREYKVDVEVKIVGKTIGVYIPILKLIEKNFIISPLALRKVDDVIMSVSRVALSTDADFDFYVIVAQDPAISDLELVIIKNVEDIKRFLLLDISRGEYFDRMVTELKITPQSEKEKAIRKLFEKLGIKPSEEVIEAYFKSSYIDTISDIGYWNGNFFLKDINMGEFLARQIEERIRKDFLRRNYLKKFLLNSVEGTYKDGVFDFKVIAEPPTFFIKGKTIDNVIALRQIYEVISKVLYGYKFEDYLNVNLFYNGEKIVFTKENLEDLKKHKMKPKKLIPVIP